MSVVGEICVLVKFSPKRENLLGNISENIEKEESDSFKKLQKLSTTRWTVRAECMKRIIDNYEPLLQLWEQCLEEKLDQDTKARIIGCKSQMESFYFFFGLNLSYKLYSMTDNPSRTLQSSRMPAIKGKKCADLVVETLKDMRKDEDFQAFYEVTEAASNSLNQLGKPTLPRKRKKPNYSILQYVTSYEGPESNAYYPETPNAYFKPMYFQALDAIINAINDRFEQPALKKFMNVEQLLLKSIVKDDISMELKDLEVDFGGDFNAIQLESELHFLPTIFGHSLPTDFREICEHLQNIEREKRPMIRNIWKIVRIVLTSGATSATPERSFSMQRRIKTWIRSTMGQKRYNSLAILNTHTAEVDQLSLIEVAERFVSGQERRRNVFGKFSEKDLHQP